MVSGAFNGFTVNVTWDVSAPESQWEEIGQLSARKGAEIESEFKSYWIAYYGTYVLHGIGILIAISTLLLITIKHRWAPISMMVSAWSYLALHTINLAIAIPHFGRFTSSLLEMKKDGIIDIKGLIIGIPRFSFTLNFIEFSDQYLLNLNQHLLSLFFKYFFLYFFVWAALISAYMVLSKRVNVTFQHRIK